MSKIKKLIGQKIKQARKEAGYKTQALFAEKLKTDTATVGRWEAGIYSPSSEHWQNIYKHTGKLRDWFEDFGQPPQVGAQTVGNMTPEQLKDLLSPSAIGIPDKLSQRLRALDESASVIHDVLEVLAFASLDQLQVILRASKAAVADTDIDLRDDVTLNNPGAVRNSGR
ncbi:hypothetical protein Bb109J_c1935 [Bdellovibrio bacteriovorus]|uniref:helix-turn-helix domain-containing protein n=1 Tax=Bdellovibrio bacteriovorus TaxID=959 RepID=UPI00045C10CA|nr:helix-turn-helix transcriptional regulator [Bdellovibrio bacteriovorus]AHZ84625.1 hypothetical protein EP01_06700 [Bdellovibrio bacteriovorus]BEV68515.1 hypothetical protein Bb109J_c1935 [Bdellovibrio bacteriovorus]